MTAKLADHSRVLRAGAAGRHPARAAGCRRSARGSDGGPKASRGALPPTARSTSSRTSTWSIWLCGRSAGHVRPAHRASPARHDRHHTRTPEVAVAGHDHRCARVVGSCGLQRAEVAQRSELPEHRRRVHADHVDLACRRRRSCTATPTAGRTGSPGISPIGSRAPADDRQPRADRDLHVAFAGIRVPRPARADGQRRRGRASRRGSRAPPARRACRDRRASRHDSSTTTTSASNPRTASTTS